MLGLLGFDPLGHAIHCWCAAPKRGGEERVQKEGDGEADLHAGCLVRFGKEMTGTGATAQLSVNTQMGEEAKTGREWASVADKGSFM